MKLQKAPFEDIKKGEKKIELRLYDKKRRKVKIGDKIEFSKLPDLKEKITVDVEALLLYKNFSELIGDISAKDLGYREEDKDYLIESMYDYYTKKEEKRWGVVGIKISL